MAISRRKFLQLGLLTTTGLVVADAFWVEKFFIETREFYLKNAQKGGPNLKIVQVSDLHLQSLDYRLQRLAQKLNKMQPDLIAFTGDAVDKAGNVGQLDAFLKLLDKSIQKTAILGNWEYWGGLDLEKLRAVYAAYNCRLLVNESVRFTFAETALSVTGVDDFIGGRADIVQALAHWEPADHHIILNHCPQYADYMATQIPASTPVDCILSGHTHGGQVNLFGFIPMLPRGSGKYVKGWYDTPARMYVSKGIGTSIVPVRFGARAEVAVFYLPRVPR